MTVSHEDVQGWLDRYVAAWKSYEPAEIRALFSADAEYRYHPWDEPVAGREEIMQDWVEPGADSSRRDAPGTFDATYEPWVVEGDRAVAVGVSRYFTDASQTTVDRTFHNCFLLRFDEDGRCASFTEFYIQER
jgi:hypothetical protein